MLSPLEASIGPQTPAAPPLKAPLFTETTPGGPAAPPNIEHVGFVAEVRTADYYDGKHARPGHILAGLDVSRPRWLKAIKEVLQREACCVIRASSGQGKSSLLYRYAYEQRAAFTILRLLRCSMETEVDAAVSYVRGLHGPVLLLVDNLGYSTRLWGQVAASLAGTTTQFLVSTREEDWHRYAPPLATNSYGFVTPTLDLNEAQQIFDELKRRGRCRGEVLSADWAYQKVAERRLLIEFIYLVTHGQMLRERLEDQIRQMHDRGEERAKLDVLRLVAMAQVYGSTIALDALMAEVSFDRDPGVSLRSLEGEYLVIEGGRAEGLHLVRSEHLVPLLHAPLPTKAATIGRLVRILDIDNLMSLVAGLVADPATSINWYIDALASRCRQERPAVIVRLAETIFSACEQRYIELHRNIFEEAISIDGRSALFFLSMDTAPRGLRNHLKDLPLLSPERKAFFQSLLVRFGNRDACGSHEALRLFGERVIGGLDPASYTYSEIARLSYWVRYARVKVRWIEHLMDGPGWEEPLLSADRETIGAFLWEVSRQVPSRYDDFLSKRRQDLLARYQVEYEVAAIAENGDAIEIRFVPDPVASYKTWNVQAVSRLEALRRWFSRYETYRSQGIFTEVEDSVIEWRDTDKNIAAEYFDVPYDDAPQNRVYIDLVSSIFAVESIAEWRRQWLAFRRSTLSAIEQLRGAYINRYHERAVRPMDLALPGQVLESIRHLPELPPDWQKRFPLCHAAMSDFWGSVQGLFNNAIMLLLPTKESDSADRRALVRTNAFNLLGRVPTMQREFAAVARLVGADEDLTALEQREIRLCREVMNLADFDQDQKGKPVRNLAAAVARWRIETNASYQSRIKAHFQPLVDAGVTMYFPERPVQEDYGTSVVIGFEVLGFAPPALLAPLDAVVSLCLRQELEFNFLYAVPCVKRQRAVKQVLRISRLAVNDLAQGRTPQFGFLPCSDPPDICSILPDVSSAGPADLAWFWDLVPLLGTLAELRKSFRLLRENLRDEGSASQFLGRSQRVSLERIGEVWAQCHQLREKADAIGPSLEHPDLWPGFVTKVDQLFSCLRSVPLLDISDDEFMETLGAFDEAYWRYASAQHNRWEGDLEL